ncbi:plasmid pRiA4b ORF-3 family protein [Corynebacterium sp.]|uniref:plasmid pRiA4b ORF-3 family protein n=1 Tax=Corynebacterium sp. TaxID=1720 RepID=UPI0026E0FB71|nr:plasmid pRiA4b ORF-3 family protein [Corynebacterium sp.]MDO5511289.1 plasmid pRiA4b ORF-3 family protein [Corynebacterium sp.]
MFNFEPPPRQTPHVTAPPATPVGFRVRVDLEETHPPVWRRLLIPGQMRLHEVHLLLQIAMGWENSHLHKFFQGSVFERRDFLTDFDRAEGEQGIFEHDVRLDQVLHDVGDKLRYEYDFGDGWTHTIKVEEVLAEEPAAPRCIGGRRACPPEDCGGVQGYHEMAEWVRTGDGGNEEMEDWLDFEWHPDHFDPEEVNAALEDHGAQVIVREEVAAVLDLVPADRASTLIRLMESAAWTAEQTPPSAAVVAQAVEPFSQLLDLVGEGVTLTGQGYLPPVLVTQLCDRLDLGGPLHGQANREANLPPVKALHRLAKKLGLLRKYRGRLLPTKIGERALLDPGLIWEQAQQARPNSRDKFEVHAAWFYLVVAGSEAAVDRWADLTRKLVGDVGWRIEHPHSSIPYPFSETRTLLEFLTHGPDPLGSSPDPERVAAVSHLARHMVFATPS